MATLKIHFSWNIHKLKELFAGNGRPYNKNKFALLSLLIVASIATGIFIVNVINLVNSEAPVKTAPQATPVEAAPIQTVTRAAPVETAPIQTAPQAVPIETAPIQTAPAPKIEIIDRFTIDSYLYRAREHEINREYSKALTSYKNVLDIEENNFMVMNNISYIYLQLALYKESIKYSIMAINIYRDYVPALTNMGIVYAKIGDLLTAEHHFKHAMQLEPANQTVILNLALLHERQGRFPEAAESYLRLVKMANVSGALGLARVYEKEGQRTKAIMFYKKIYKSGLINVKTSAFVRHRIMILQNDQRKAGK